MSERKNAWYCLDETTKKYYRINENGTFSFIEKVWLDTCKGDEGYPDKNYTVKAATINLDDYTDYEMECAISGYFESMDTLKEFWEDDSRFGIASCIFEEMCDGDGCATAGVMTEKEADIFLESIVTWYRPEVALDE